MNEQSKSILMVCLGNICRSPLAHGILEDMCSKKNLDIKVDSAGTSGYHDGELPDRRSIEIATKHGLDITSQRSRKFTINDFDEYDLILAMDSSNYTNIVNLARSEEDKNKVKLIMNYSFPGENRKVPDPYYEGGFDSVYDMLEQAVEDMINVELSLRYK